MSFCTFPLQICFLVVSNSSKWKWYLSFDFIQCLVSYFCNSYRWVRESLSQLLQFTISKVFHKNIIIIVNFSTIKPTLSYTSQHNGSNRIPYCVQSSTLQYSHGNWKWNYVLVLKTPRTDWEWDPHATQGSVWFI